jgi:hypothetical protein
MRIASRSFGGSSARRTRSCQPGQRGCPVVCRQSSSGKCEASPRIHCSSHAQVDHQPGYHVAAMGAEAVRFLVLWMAGWINSRQLEVIDFLREENCVLREQLGERRLRFTDDQRRRLAVTGRTVGRRRLGEFAGLVTPDTILRWYRELITRKYDGSARRRAGRPTVAVDDAPTGAAWQRISGIG